MGGGREHMLGCRQPGLGSLFCRDEVIWAKRFCLNSLRVFQTFSGMSVEPEFNKLLLKQNPNI